MPKKKKEPVIDIKKLLDKNVKKAMKPIADSETMLNYQKQLVLDSLARQLEREEILISQLEKNEALIEENKAIMKRNAERTKEHERLNQKLQSWVDFIDDMTKTAFKHGHCIASFKKIKLNGKNVVVGDKLTVFTEKTLRNLRINDINIFNPNKKESEIRLKAYEFVKEHGSTLSEKEKRRYVEDIVEGHKKPKIEKERQKSKRRLENGINQNNEKVARDSD